MYCLFKVQWERDKYSTINKFKYGMNKSKMPSITFSRPLDRVPRAIIVGASSGIGAALALRLAREGYMLALLSRREQKLQRLCDDINNDTLGQATYFVHDVKFTSDVPELLLKVCAELGGLDLFIYNAGTQYPNNAAAYSHENDLTTFHVNLLGAAAWLNLVAERFQKLSAGHIVAVGSVAGDRGRSGMPAYTASKAGLHTYIEGFRNRLNRHGVVVTTIKPGQVRTSLLKNAGKELWPISAEMAAEYIWRAIKRRRMVVYVPSRWFLVGWIVRLIPSILFRKLNI